MADEAAGAPRCLLHGLLLHLHGTALRPVCREQRARDRRHLWSARTHPGSATHALSCQGTFCLYRLFLQVGLYRWPLKSFQSKWLVISLYSLNSIYRWSVQYLQVVFTVYSVFTVCLYSLYSLLTSDLIVSVRSCEEGRSPCTPIHRSSQASSPATRTDRSLCSPLTITPRK